MRPHAILALVVALTLVFGPVGAALAKKSGSFSSGGSRSGSSGWSSSSRPSTPPPSSPSPAPSGSSGWSSTSKPAPAQQSATPAPSAAPPAAAAPAPSQTPGGWSNTAGTQASGAGKQAGGSAFSNAGSDAVKRQAAATSYQGYQGLYTKPGNPVSPGQVTTNKPILSQNRSFGSYQDYNRYRDNYYSGRGWSAPGYAFNSFSGFGMWDAMFMWFMLSNLTSGAGFFHNHQADPGVQAFKQEAAKLAESNADLKKQLDEMNAKLDQMKKDGTPVDPTAMPKDVDPNVALAQPKIEEPKNAAGSLFWPIVTLVLAGGAAWMLFGRRRAAT
ncbi:hypothetical protein NNJEOMEG_00850 [Fundidesulfovibrio magnetotacticus]|uniref:Uncharacterized protein n=1 Tax=Fundidesulfovibrio magnetotacticus TaxID=2730080 RepID=A0A6V8LR35_9BACT|nr:hypothetical protein [Fundidesulfovibrio magnetotacticus]GFK93021.1 hypothetical protein NNJEOMEG_00850 [Fundidesulfovibrio magnetotacticus]